MQRSNIQPNLFQQMLDSASNAAEKGQAQYFTPPKWAKLLAIPLPSHRPTIIDLTCGRGDLLRAAANGSTKNKLGCDIDGSQLSTLNSQLSADLTLFAPLLVHVRMQADLFTLNPPWDLHWHRERLAWLADSDLGAVRHAFKAHDRRTPKGTIDSTVATLCIALDRCSDYGEGYIITNAATARRLILDKDAPHVALRDHIWAVVNLPEKTAAPVSSCVLYFAKDHLVGPRSTDTDFHWEAPDEPISDFFSQLFREHLNLREGAEVRPFAPCFTDDTIALWNGAAEEFRRVHSRDGHQTPRYNLWLDHTGHIGAHVSLYDDRTGRVPKGEAVLLHSLASKRPMQLVVQRAQRDALKRAVADGSPWRVDPALQTAVVDAIREYNAARAPLYPLPAIQRLGYLDEEDWIVCDKPLGLGKPDSGQFISGKRYAITTQTLAVRRKAEKISLAGETDELELTGQELAIFITGETGERICFMEQRLLNDGVRIRRAGDSNGRTAKKSNLSDDGFVPADEVIHFTLQQLVDVFIVPEVPDVAAVNPAGYQRNLELLQQIERLCQTN